MPREMPVKVRLKALDSLSGVLDKVKAKFPEMTRAVSRTNTAFDILSKTHEKWSKKVAKMGQSMQTMGGYLTAGITLPVVAMGGLALKNFADFETALIGVGKTTDMSGEALKALGERFMDLSKRVPVSAVELLNLGQAAAQLGVQEPNLLEFAETMAMLARTTNIAGEEGAADLARFITVTRGSMGDVRKFASALVELGNTSAATENEILQFALRMGGSTAIFGVSSTQALALSTALRQVGIESEAGSSAIQRALGDMNTAISQGGTKMQVLAKLTGISADQLKSRFKEDAVGVLRDFASGLDRLAKNGGDISQAMRYFGLDGVRDVQVMGALSQNVGELDKKLRTANEAFEKGSALNKEFSAALESLDAQTQLAKNEFFNLSRQIGADLAPTIISILGVFRGFMNFMSEHPKIRTMALVVAGLAAVVGPLVLIFGTLLTLSPSLVTGWALFTAGMAGFGIVSWAALAPILLIIAKVALIGAVIVGVIAILWKFRDVIWDTIITSLEYVWNLLKKIHPGAMLIDWAVKKWSGGEEPGTGPTADAPAGKALVPAGPPVGGIEARDRMNPEWLNRTNNARVDINVRAPQSTSIVAESDGGFLGIERGMAGAF